MTAVTQMTTFSRYRKRCHNRHYRHGKEKVMRNKTLGINVRVTPAEKEKLSENASYCGLSLSEYLRRVGLGKEVKAILEERDYKAFLIIKRIK